MVSLIVMLLFIGTCAGLSMQTSPISASAMNKNVLVIGGTGRVGRSVVPKLIKGGFNVRVMCRDIIKAKTFEELIGAELVEGDVCNIDSLVKATVDIFTVLDVHGMKPSRFSKITDLFVHPKNIPYHPYNVNYMGVKRILAAMTINKCSKIIRITGAFVDKSAFSPIRVLFNLLLSMTSAWHEVSEIAIRDSGFDYTVIRPTEIVQEASVVDLNRSLTLIPGDSKEPGKLGNIPIPDLTDLLMISVSTNGTCVSTDGTGEQSMLYKSTAICTTVKDEGEVKGEKNWDGLVQKIPQDTKVLIAGPHRRVLALYTTLLGVILTLLGKGTYFLISNLIKISLNFYTKKFV